MYKKLKCYVKHMIFVREKYVLYRGINFKLALALLLSGVTTITMETIILLPMSITTIIQTTFNTTVVVCWCSNIKWDYIFYGIYAELLLDIKGSLFLLKRSFK